MSLKSARKMKKEENRQEKRKKIGENLKKVENK